MISGTYKFSVNELIKANGHASKELARRSFRIILTPLGVCMLLTALFLLGERDTFLRIYVGLIGAYLTFLRVPVTKMIVRRQFAKRPDQNIEIKFDASDDGMNWSSKDSNSSFRWSLISKARKYRDGFLIFPNHRIFHWIPNHSLASQDEIDALAEIFKKNIKDYKNGA